MRIPSILQLFVLFAITTAPGSLASVIGIVILIFAGAALGWILFMCCVIALSWANDAVLWIVYQVRLWQINAATAQLRASNKELEEVLKRHNH